MLKQGSRKPPENAPKPSFSPPSGFCVQLKTITPMFGGSATTREVDPLQPVRAASVRGHLRFWWRATAGAKYNSAKELFEAESEIWGNTEKAGKVRLEVKVTDAGKECEPVRHSPRRDKVVFDFGQSPAYALFPFQGTIKQGQTDERPAKAREDVAFTLTVYCPEPLRPQIEAAVHAWVMFGGIGSRTRRGCGSLALVGEALTLPSVVAKGENPLTTLPQRYFLGQPHKNAEDAWAEAVDVYRRFRQGEGEARTKREAGAKAPGRSFWPEPDRIRILRDQYLDKIDRDSGQRKIHKPVENAFGFPRADLGLPIIFRFKDGGKGRQQDPEDQELRLNGKNRKRFSSPVITKAIKLDEGYHAMIAILNSPRVWDIEDLDAVLIDLGDSRRQGELKITKKELQAAQRTKSPLPSEDIREAFAEFCSEARHLKGQHKDRKIFKEIKL